MEWFTKLIEWLKLPTKIIAFIALMSCAFLFLPSKIIETLKLQDFIDLYGKYFGVVFIVASSYLLFIFLGFVFSKVKSMFINLKNNKNAKENSKIKKQQIQSALCDLTQSEKCLLREFYLQGKDVIKVIYANEDVISLINKEIIYYASECGERYIFGTVVNVRLNDYVKKSLSLPLLGLPAEPTKSDLERCAKERPAFIWQIQSIEELKSSMLNSFHRIF
ncbi:MAG: superinfection exclusion B family protein [Treponema sp.]|nr:superinfection exclusion B family protein [Treponema sp.]